MALFKALIFTVLSGSEQITPTEMGPFQDQPQCMEAARTVFQQNGQIKAVSENTVEGKVVLYTPGTSDDDLGVRIVCYKAAGVL